MVTLLLLIVFDVAFYLQDDFLFTKLSLSEYFYCVLYWLAFPIEYGYPIIFFCGHCYSECIHHEKLVCVKYYSKIKVYFAREIDIQ